MVAQTIRSADQLYRLSSFIVNRGDSMHQQDIRTIANYCKANLHLETAQLMDEFYYQSLPFSVIDAVFSINAKYASARNVVIRLCDHYRLNRINRQKPGPTTDQLSTSAFIKLYDQHGIDFMTEQVYENRQRTSTTNGILKSEAVLRFSKVLQSFGVEYLQDVGKVIGATAFEQQIQRIPGQNSGISLRIFYAMVGSDDHVTPSRNIARFIEAALNRSVDIEDCDRAIIGACDLLLADYPHLTPRLLDNAIWKHQTS